jgi:predicted phosphodiesterase
VSTGCSATLERVERVAPGAVEADDRDVCPKSPIPARIALIGILVVLTGGRKKRMRLAALADIHGNWPALEAVAHDLERQQVDHIIGLGDYVMTSAGSHHIVAWMQRQAHASFVRGNGDSWGHYQRFRSLARVDPYPLYDAVSRLPERALLEAEGIRILAQHAVPGDLYRRERSLAVLRYIMTRAYAETVMDLRDIDVVLVGDLHVPSIDVQPEGVLVTAGTVGLWWPATYVLIELDGPCVHFSFQQVEYDREAAVRAWREAYLMDPGPDGPHGASKLERAAADRALAYDWPFDIPYWVTPGERVTWRKP